MMLRFGFFLLVLFGIVYFLYYRKTHRRDYFFTLVLLSVSIFFLIYLLGSVKVKIGFAPRRFPCARCPICSVSSASRSSTRWPTR